ncbi:hypothetical protein [Corallococcus terminator]|uniref:hypothetical protein n=1 Tax=Corallococcus terminator TaxID=2316733 RepID=UPI0011C47671|nr:hypothetical protein [Corallococcus terminator]
MRSTNVKASLSLMCVLSLGVGCGKTPDPGPKPEPEGPRNAVLVRDGSTGVVPGVRETLLRDFVDLGPTVLFTQDDALHGRELWTTDGSTQGTALLLDLMPGNMGSEPGQLTRVDDAVFFAARTAQTLEYVNLFALWRTRGTLASTTQLVSLPQRPAFVVARSGGVYFAAPDVQGSQEEAALWTSDGTPEGTRRVGTPSGARILMKEASAARLGEALLFTARTAQGDPVLWRTDGTPEGTRAVLAFPGAQGFALQQLTTVGNQVLFWAKDTTSATRLALWRSDGTPAGTLQLKSLAPPRTDSTAQQGFVARDGAAFFAASDVQTGTELWKTDGTPGGTVLVSDLGPGAAGCDPTALTFQGPYLYFVARPDEQPPRLFRTNGTDPGTTRMNGRIGDAPQDPSPTGGTMIATDGALFFLASTQGETGLRLWRAEATAVARAVSDPLPSPLGLMLQRGSLYLITVTGELWTHGGESGPASLLSQPPPRPQGSFDQGADVVDVNGALYFTQPDEIAGLWQLWKSDGTKEGTVQAKPPSTGTNDSVRLSPENLTAVNGRLLFTSKAPSLGVPFALWGYDAASGKAALLSSALGQWVTPRPQGPSVFTSRPLVVGAQAYFLAMSPRKYPTPDELWRTDGTLEGTVRVKAGLTPFLATTLMSVGGRLFFEVSEDFDNCSLWTTDGTEAGTVRLTAPSASGFSALSGVAVGDQLFFWALVGTDGIELWKTNGTPEGTVRIGDAAGADTRLESPGTSVGGTFFFARVPPNEAPQLWMSDGRTLERVGTFGPVGSPLWPAELTAQGDHLLFWAATPTNGYALWRVDGRGANATVLLRASSGGGVVATPSRLVESRPGGPMLFAASDGATGLELWKTDGTPGNTMRVTDLAAGPASSAPDSRIVPSGNRIYFPAWTPEEGRELWALPMP